ncbi:LuxR C-terminal-related transcriptional regulator [Dongia rigui]|uniref:LuxR C-terminal-related transcriptional regulator n=1 Tax=Dongia rigui TaxID=940149 RepID=A0ABU5E4I0_9PROT|nr:LuxR C-terminal-related transcriptional regulator [Dongia rigui]MDY0873766.1 LuxR C-terminal-related transcriptional regulator [Dongia rigui]
MLIETKLRPPELKRDLVARARLLRQLDGALAARLVVLSAPPGFGKSTLLGQWIASLKARDAAVGWLALDRDDDEIGRFLSYLVAALQRADPQVAPHVPALLQSSPVLPVDSVLTSIVNDLSHRTQPLFLILDDCQFLSSPEICRFLDALLAYAPASLHLVVATRGPLPFGLAHMRVRGQLINLDDMQLRFSLEETESLFQAAELRDLPLSDVVTLQHRTEGWVAGLQLASLSLEEPAGRAAFIRNFSGSHRDVAEFLTQDVLARQSPDLRDFLIKTSILSRISAPLADAVLGRDDSAAMLQAIEAANLFLIPLDRERHWFRYHHLFAEFLQAQLQEVGRGEIAKLHGRAADWLSANGLTSEAVAHALAAGDADRAAALVEDCAMPLIMASHLNTVRAWLGQLPPDLIARRPRLQLAEVWIQFHMSRPQEAARTLKSAKQSIVAAQAAGKLDRETQAALQAELCTLTVGVVSAADRSRTAARLADSWADAIPENRPFFKGTLGNINAFCHFSLGDLDGARILSLKARDSHGAAQSVFGVVYSDLILGLVEKAAGNLTGAAQFFARAIAAARRELGAGSYAEAMVAIFEVELLYEWCDLAGAERLLHTHRQIIEECGLVVHEMACKLHLARIAAARGRHDEAMAVLERAERLGIEKRYHRLTASALNDRVRLLLQRGDVQAARFALPARGVGGEGKKNAGLAALTPATEPEFMAQARVLIASAKPEAALKLLDRVADNVRRDGRLRRLSQVRALAAIASYQAGDALSALAAAVDAVSICAPQKALRTLVDEGQALREVIDFSRKRMPSWSGDTPTGQFLDRLMDEFGKPERGPTQSAHLRKGDPGFSPREIDVVQLLGIGHSNRDMAQALGMAPDTVKWHLKNIFGKLGVANRTQAVLRLQDIGLTLPQQPGP